MGRTMFMRTMIVVAVMCAALAGAAAAQTVTTNPLSASAYCGGDVVSVGYTASGTFAPGNAFIVQLSGPAGSFTDGMANIGSESATASGTVQATIPAPDVTTSARHPGTSSLSSHRPL